MLGSLGPRTWYQIHNVNAFIVFNVVSVHIHVTVLALFISLRSDSSVANEQSVIKFSLTSAWCARVSVMCVYA